MSRLIDADALLIDMAKHTIVTDDLYGMGIMAGVDSAIKTIAKQPTIDAVPVVHGRWIHPEGYVVTNGFLCSECGNEEVSHRPIYPRPGGAFIADEHGNFFYPPDKKFCHNCGAKMDLEVEG